MKTKILFFAFLFFSFSTSHAQQFISKARIEYEVKANIKKTMGNNSFEEMLKDNLPTFKTGYYILTFADNKSIYKFDHWDDKAKVPDFLKKSDEENVWYFDYNTGKFNMQKNVWGSNLNVEDSIKNFEWKLTNENRVIAGFNCRKAVAKIFDSVYVFAFYTNEITIPGGPCSINGLPGMIMGITIPRLFTSWIATRVMLNGVDASLIKPVSTKKSYSMKNLKASLDDHTKDWYSDDAEENKEIIQQKARFEWETML
ncbi:MAG: GLPGLI family protein [Bacteroidota bacterium]|nr:GLPGLI family protein [Bacteroidota bacterium]